MKTCTKCLEERDLSEFAFRSKAKGTRAARCKYCVKAYYNTYYEVNKADEIARAKSNSQRLREERREQVFAYLQGKACIDCKESDPVVLDFDHVSGVKTAAVSEMILACFSWAKILEEIEKCEIRCANCHRRKTAREQNSYRSRLKRP